MEKTTAHIVSSKNKQSVSLAESQVSKIFLTLKAVYANKFMSAFKTDNDIMIAQAVWAKHAWYLTDEEIDDALSACLEVSDWQPNLPEFIRYALNLPSKDEAVAMVLSNNFDDPVSRCIKSNIGPWELSNQPQHVLKTRIIGHYEICYLKVIDSIKGERK